MFATKTILDVRSDLEKMRDSDARLSAVLEESLDELTDPLSVAAGIGEDRRPIRGTFAEKR